MDSKLNHTNKRARNLIDSDSEDDTLCFVEGAWPRFLVVQAEDPSNPLSKLSPFVINILRVFLLPFLTSRD